MPRTTVAQRAILPTRAPITPTAVTMLLDTNLRLIKHVPWQRAVTMLMADSVNALMPYLADDGHGSMVPVLVRSPSRVLELPYIVSLKQYVYDPYGGFLQATSEKASTRAILTRDGYVCAYCGGRASTKDHVLPKSRGGGSTWSNLVAACYACNQAKRDRTPAEAGMPLMWEPTHYDGFSQDLQDEIWEFLTTASGQEPASAAH